MIYDEDKYDLIGLESTVRRTAKVLREHIDEFDSIAVSGMSGVVVGAPVSLRIRKPLVVIRKPHEASHAQQHSGHEQAHINIEYVGKRVLFLDDFVFRGETRDRVIEAIEQRGAELVASYMYTDDRYKTWEPSPRRVPVGRLVEEPGMFVRENEGAMPF